MTVNWSIARLTAVVYFIQGGLGIASIALPLYLRSLEFTIAQIAYISSLSTAPWFFKIIYGAISDAYPIGGRRRKPYLVICSIISCVGWLLLSISPPSAWAIVGCMMVAHLGLAATDVIADGLVVDHSDAESARMYQSISWGSRAVGALISGVVGGILAAKLEAKVVFAITSVLPLFSLFAAFMITDDPVSERDRKNVLVPIIKSIRLIFAGDLKWFVLFIVVGSAPAAVGTPLFFYFRETLGFDEIFLGSIQSISWLGAIIGCVLFMKLFTKIPLKTTRYCS